MLQQLELAQPVMDCSGLTLFIHSCVKENAQIQHTPAQLIIHAILVIKVLKDLKAVIFVTTMIRLILVLDVILLILHSRVLQQLLFVRENVGINNIGTHQTIVHHVQIQIAIFVVRIPEIVQTVKIISHYFQLMDQTLHFVEEIAL
jgi:hypothetical protein